jgi:tetratricopeptide (TPR) repeat protein
LPLLGLLQACQDPATLHQRQAEVLLGQGEYARAASEYEEAFKANPRLSDLVQKQGALAWAKAGEYAKAAAILQRLAERAQGSERPRAYQELAAFYVEPAGALEEAERWYERALALAPGDTVILTRLAELAVLRGKALGAEGGSGGAGVSGVDGVAGVADPAQLAKAIERYQQLIELEPRAVAPLRRQREVMVAYLASLETQQAAALAQAEASQADELLSDDFRRRADEFSARAAGLQGRLEEVDERLAAAAGAEKKE